QTTDMIDAFVEGLGDLAFLPLDEACRGIVERAARAYAVNPRLRRVIVEQVPDVFDIANARDFDDALLRILEGYFEFHSEKLRPQNARLAATIIHFAVEGAATALMMRDPGALRQRETVDELTALVLGYLRRVT